jgi:ribonuclease Y
MLLSESAFGFPLLAGLAVAVAVLFAALWTARRIVARGRESARALAEEARQESESKARETLVGAQEKALALEEEADRRDRELEARESSVDSRARELDGETSALERQRRDLARRQSALSKNEQSVQESLDAARAELERARAAIERAAGMTAAEARAELVASLEDDARRDGARLARRIEEEARETAERSALRLVLEATERINLREAVESTVSFIELPSDEMKGRIIGREGRNIRALEMATGIDVIVDDTPRAILISSFDPTRREVARVAIGRLIEDGRIHPARIEEVVAKVQTELDTITEQAGSQAAFNLGISDPHPRLARLIGRLKFRTYHGHNLLQHCTEVALVAGHMAAEIGGRVEVVRRAALLHEVGRVDETASGHTVLASADLAAKYGESEEVVHAIQSLHPDSEAATLEALLLRIANRISDNRPGARKDNLDLFVERLRRIEAIALSFPGVVKAYSVKAGKDLRVIVDTQSVSDEDAYALSKSIARAIEKDVVYSGQIRVSVIRETRSVQFAV